MDEDLKHLVTVKERVEWIYKNSQDAVDSNSVLSRLYESYFGESSESVTRAGRWLRSEKAKDKRFIRTPENVERDAKLFDLNRSYWVGVDGVQS